MKKFGYNRPALLLGFILGGYFEIYFWLSYQTGGPFFFLPPGSLVILSVIVFSYSIGPVRQFIDNRWIKRTGS